MSDGIDALEKMVERLTADNAKLRAEVEYIKADDSTWFARMDEIEADLARVTRERDMLLRDARRLLAASLPFGAELDSAYVALRAAVAACTPGEGQR